MHKSVPQYKTLLEYVYYWIDTTPNKVFLRQPKGDKWKEITYKEAYIQASKIASGLQHLGLKKGDHVAIYSKNCYHWILADLAIMMGGYVSIPLYASLSEEQLANVLELGDVKALFIGKLDHWNENVFIPSSTLKIIHFPHYPGNAKVNLGISWNRVLDDNEVQEERFIPNPKDIWTILFTSGTTGKPKGVIHLHQTPAQIVLDDLKYETIGVWKMKDPTFFSYLPLNHVGEKIGVHSAALVVGGSISFGESIDTFVKNLQDTAPTLFFSVPRIWNKFYQGVNEKLSLNKQKILFRIPILSTIVKNKIKGGLGLRRASIVATGAAITPMYLKKWYKNLGIHLIEVYGMTEVCGSFTYGSDAKTPFDSVGKPLPGAEIQIDKETGEILMKTPYMMIGYYKDEELTNRVLVNDWLRTGDKGEIDKNGFVKITGRISDVFKTSKGKFISPATLEEHLGGHYLIELVCIVGLGIPQPIALINLTEQANELTKSEIEAVLKLVLVELNKTVPNYQKVTTLVLETNLWSVQNTLITPTLKVRRKAIDQKYNQHYWDWYNDDRKIIWI